MIPITPLKFCDKLEMWDWAWLPYQFIPPTWFGNETFACSQVKMTFCKFQVAYETSTNMHKRELCSTGLILYFEKKAFATTKNLALQLYGNAWTKWGKGSSNASSLACNPDFNNDTFAGDISNRYFQQHITQSSSGMWFDTWNIRLVFATTWRTFMKMFLGLRSPTRVTTQIIDDT